MHKRTSRGIQSKTLPRRLLRRRAHLPRLDSHRPLSHGFRFRRSSLRSLPSGTPIHRAQFRRPRSTALSLVRHRANPRRRRRQHLCRHPPRPIRQPSQSRRRHLPSPLKTHLAPRPPPRSNRPSHGHLPNSHPQLLPTRLRPNHLNPLSLHTMIGFTHTISHSRGPR